MAKTPRKNKSKKEIVHDIKALQETERIRKMVREEVYPFLLELNDTIGFSKIFMQTCAVSLDTAFNNLSRDMKVADLLPKLEEIYKEKIGQNEMYVKFFKRFKGESISTLTSLIEMMPRHIESYFTQEVDKKPILELPIERILG